MGKIRHLAIRTEDPERLAEFYKDVFGLTEVHRGSHPGMAPGKTVHLTDGYFELALLDNAAQQSRNGLYHFGIQIDPGEKTVVSADTELTLLSFDMPPVEKAWTAPMLPSFEPVPGESVQDPV